MLNQSPSARLDAVGHVSGSGEKKHVQWLSPQCRMREVMKSASAVDRCPS